MCVQTQSENVSLEEFVDYHSYVSSTIESDAQFSLIMGAVWDVSGSNENQAYAGSSRRITAVNAREAYRADHHRNLFGTDSSTPFSKKPQTEWQTTQSGNFQKPNVNSYMPSAGGSSMASSGSNDPRMAWAKQTQRDSGANYQDIQHDD